MAIIDVIKKYNHECCHPHQCSVVVIISVVVVISVVILISVVVIFRMKNQTFLAIIPIGFSAGRVATLTNSNFDNNLTLGKAIVQKCLKTHS